MTSSLGRMFTYSGEPSGEERLDMRRMAGIILLKRRFRTRKQSEGDVQQTCQLPPAGWLHRSRCTGKGSAKLLHSHAPAPPEAEVYLRWQQAWHISGLTKTIALHDCDQNQGKAVVIADSLSVLLRFILFFRIWKSPHLVDPTGLL